MSSNTTNPYRKKANNKRHTSVPSPAGKSAPPVSTATAAPKTHHAASTSAKPSASSRTHPPPLQSQNYLEHSSTRRNNTFRKCCSDHFAYEQWNNPRLSETGGGSEVSNRGQLEQNENIQQ
jgi:hypothetical protein